jgi:hypothetical protein
MPCFVPEEYRHLRWHILQSHLIEDDPPTFYERSEWVNCAENGETEGGHWLRYGRVGDFPSLCKCIYIGPADDQESSWRRIDGPFLDQRPTVADIAKMVAA